MHAKLGRFDMGKDMDGRWVLFGIFLMKWCREECGKDCSAENEGGKVFEVGERGLQERYMMVAKLPSIMAALG